MSNRIIINKKLITSKVSTILRSLHLTIPIDIEELKWNQGGYRFPYPLSDDVSQDF